MAAHLKEQPVKFYKSMPGPGMLQPTVPKIFDELAAQFKLTSRNSQLVLAETVASTLAGGGICCIEAPTGTGKTLGYLAGALDAQARAAEPIPIVVATATVGLQDQILKHDIPRLAAIGALDPAKVAVAKGRGRYFCPRTAALLEDKKMQDSQNDLFDADKVVVDSSVPQALAMLDAWRSKQWNGDKDSWDGVVPSCWDVACAANRATCVNQSCEYYESCPYLASRNKLATASVIIANHDIVLADLSQRAMDQSNSVLPAKKYSLIFDEAHNLPDKAVALKKATARLYDTAILHKLGQYGERVLATPAVVKALEKSTDYGSDIFAYGSAVLIAGLDRLAHSLADSSALTFGPDGIHTWGLRAPPASLVEGVAALAEQTYKLECALQDASKTYTAMAEEAVGVEKHFAIRQLAETHSYEQAIKDLNAGLMRFSDGESAVRWVQKTPQGLALHVQPLEGQDVLNSLLWETDIPVALVSATLQIAGSFERFRQKTGLPRHALTKALPPVFDYSRGCLLLPHMDSQPGHPNFDRDVAATLVKLFAKNLSQGTLVLFTSRESLRRVAEALPQSIADDVLRQDKGPVPELVLKHRARIDAGQRSILFGLDSMAEGLDLPGNYCGHVVITRLPFAVPSDPVELARKEALGSRTWFDEAYLADMLTMLIQSCGRLIRREDDHGVITVLDERLVTKGYAAKALAALPTFTRIKKTAEYGAMCLARGFGAASLGPSTAPRATPAAAVATVPNTPRSTQMSPAPAKPAPAGVPPRAARHAAPVVSNPVATLEHELTLKLAAAEVAATRIDGVTRESPLAVMLKALAVEPSAPLSPEVSAVPVLGACVHTCLPPKTPAMHWADRALSSATMQAVLMLNTRWVSNHAPWQKALRLRPDLLQFAQIWRNHACGLLDERNELVTASASKSAVEKLLASLGLPSKEALFTYIQCMEQEFKQCAARLVKKPTAALIREVVSLGVRITSSFTPQPSPALP